MNKTAATWPAIPPLPPARPWRLGTTSYVYPADLLANVEQLAGHVQDIELVLFESVDAGNLPDAATVARLAALAATHGFTYTVHFPIDRKLGSDNPAERADLMLQMLAIIDALQPLQPHAYILHLEGVAADAAPARIAVWQHDVSSALTQILSSGIDPRLLAVENLGFPFDWCAPLIEAFDLSVCVDTGHLWLQGLDAAEHFRRWAPRTRVIHLHGEAGGRDHISLARTDADRLAGFLSHLGDYQGVVTLEVFSYEDTASSIATLAQQVRA
jgi:sugar phosphate isomerase/epimerase